MASSSFNFVLDRYTQMYTITIPMLGDTSLMLHPTGHVLGYYKI